MLVWTGGTASVEYRLAAYTGSGAARLHPITPDGKDPRCRTLEGERKQVSVFFADIKDSTRLIEGLDPEAAAAGPGHPHYDARRAPL